MMMMNYFLHFHFNVITMSFNIMSTSYAVKMHPFITTRSSKQLILLCFLVGVLVPGSLGKDYWDAGLKTHNDYREVHNTSLLELDTGLAEIADKCAQYYSDLKKIDHSCPERKAAKVGENISWGTDTSLDGVEAVKTATKVWYAEVLDYDFKKHRAKSEGKVVGHFTQLIWKSTKKLGIGYFRGEDGIFVVALYSPAGNNWKNKENVLPFSRAAAIEVSGIRSVTSSAASPSTLKRGQNGRGTTCLALVMSAGLVAGRF